MVVTIINLILALIILILGIWAFYKRKSDIAKFKQQSGEGSAPKAIAVPEVALWVGIAFGLFAVSHALTLAGLATSLETFLIIIRILGYLLVILALSRILMKR